MLDVSLTGRRRKGCPSTERWWKVAFVHLSLSHTNDVVCLLSSGLLVNGLAEEAIELFSTLNDPNEIILVLLMNSCAQVRTAKALQIGRQAIDQMSEITRRNKYIMSSTLNMFIRCGDVCSAEKWFAKVKCAANNYGQMMKCYNDERLPHKTLNLFKKMKNEGIRADSTTYLLLLNACSQLGIESISRSIVEQISVEILDNVKIQSALIDTWVRRTGWISSIDSSSSSRVNQEMLIERKNSFKRSISPILSHSTRWVSLFLLSGIRLFVNRSVSLVHSYGLNGLGPDALQLFRRISPEMISDTTYMWQGKLKFRAI